MITKVRAFGEDVELMLVKTTYANNGRMAIRAIESADGSPFGVVTVNIEGETPDEGCVFVKTWGENEEWVGTGLRSKTELFEDTGRRIPTGYVVAEQWRVLF